jgi:hypothetical protein
MLEVNALERLARLAVGPVEQHLGQRPRHRAPRQHALDVVELDLLVERAQREVLHHALELGEIAGPDMMAQRVERRDRQSPRRAAARLHHLREHERRQVRHVLGELAQRGQPQRQLGEPRSEVGVEVVLFGQALYVER